MGDRYLISVPGTHKKFFSKMPRPVLGSPSLLSICYRGFFLR